LDQDLGSSELNELWFQLGEQKDRMLKVIEEMELEYAKKILE
jgi:hypothetical protein